MMEPFQSPRLLLDRAHSHIEEFKFHEKGFVKKKPYRLFKEEDAKSGKILFKAKITIDMPAVLPAIVFDILGELRSSLDHAVYDSTRLLTGNASPKYTKFPFGKSKTDAEKDLGRKHSQVPAVMWPFLLSFKPFNPQEGGERTLFGLNEMRNGKIHRILTEMAMANSSVGFGNGYIGTLHIDHTKPSWDREKRELTYMTASVANMSIDIHISVFIAFDEGTEFAGSEVVTTLNELHGICAGIVNGIEAETTKLMAAKSQGSTITP